MTVENSVIVPLFVIVLVMMITFNLMLHDKIVDRTKQLRTNYIAAFENEEKQPEEVLRMFWAGSKLL